MKSIIHLSKRMCILMLLFASITATGQQIRKVTRIDRDWRFHLGDSENAQAVKFDDGKWRKLDVPHDWSIEGDYDENAVTKRGGGYLPAGVGWYRKSLTLPKADAGKRVFIEFGAVMANSDVWVNGHHLGHHPFGYVPLLYDLTDHVTFDGKPNIIAVKADNTPQPASRWYTGAGIYRHVDLITVAPVHLERYGVFISTPEASKEKAVVSVKSSVVNQSKQNKTLTVQTVITSPAGKSLQSEATPLTVKAGETATCEQTIAVTAPELWDIESPNLYTAVTTVSEGKNAIDDQQNTFGIRFFEFRSETGFWLNGRNIKLLGACVHHDGGAVGSAVPASVWERRIERLKAVGCNALRGAHAPMDPSFYDLCDRMGVLLLDEVFDTWTSAKPNGEKAYNRYYNEWWDKDTEIAIKRVRNHPSIVLLSLGNEIRDNVNSAEGRQRFLDLRELTKQLDPTRPITMALFRAQMMGLYDNGFSEMLDVIGQNYGEMGLIAAWKGKEGRKIIGTENTPARSGWLVAKNNPQYSGMFIWTGIDYLGESDWPQTTWGESLFDRNAGWRHLSWERQSWWTTQPMVHIVRRDDGVRRPIRGGGWTDDWTPSTDLDTARVTVYSNCEEVELYLNGKSLGKQAVPADDAANSWVVVPYEKGTVKVIGRNGGKDVAEHAHTSATEPVKLLLEPEKTELINDWDEVVYVTATLVDKNGVRSPNTPVKVKFDISGPGEIVSVDNSDNLSHERYKANAHTTHKGMVLAIVRATANSGAIKLTASADGMESVSVTMQAKAK
jgi:beta-galactosidase